MAIICDEVGDENNPKKGSNSADTAQLIYRIDEVAHRMEAIDQERKRTINDIKNQIRFVSIICSKFNTFSGYFYCEIS